MESSLSTVDHKDYPQLRASAKTSAYCYDQNEGTTVASPALLQAQTRQLKHELKDWESAFSKENGRVPTKRDLADMPNITEKYKHYSRLKRLLDRRRSAINESATIHEQNIQQVGAVHEDMESRQRGANRAGWIDLPLETSTLRGSVKRKTVQMVSGDSLAQTAEPPSAVGPTPTDSYAELSLNKEASTNCPSSILTDKHAFTPKRQRMALSFDLLNSIKPIESRPPGVEHVTASEPTHTICTRPIGSASAIPNANYPSDSAAEGLADGVGECDGDMIAYTPPPSLIRHYGTYKRRALSTDYQPSYSPLLPSLSAMTVCGNPPDGVDAGIANSESDMLSAGNKDTRFRARVGNLVKTTSIPLNAFSAQLKTASGPLDLKVNEVGGDQDTSRDALDGHQDQADLVDLVMDDPKDAHLLPINEEGTGQTSAHKKKATQKRSTRRVKIKPLDHDKGDARPPIRSLRSDSQNLVSSNFYKLKLKGKKRSNYSSEGRRTALYKRMIGKKKGDTSGSNAAENVHECSDEPSCMSDTFGREHGNAFMDANDMPEDDYVQHGALALDSEAGETSTEIYKQNENESCTISGEPLSRFYADESTCSQERCSVSPLFSKKADFVSKGKMLDLGRILQRVWGFSEFRQNQIEPIKHILSGCSTLLVLATGSGKSLAYQLPALVLSVLFGGLTLVVTPLISLMRDQIQSLPSCLHAICMSSETSFGASYADTKSRLLSGKVQLLFVSPERVQSPRFQEMMAADGMPSIHFAVIDEVHCASEWSHNFRPAYLQLPHMLRKIGASRVLAMTGTATELMVGRLCTMFGINMANNVVRGDAVRDNIKLSVVTVDVDARSLSRSSAREETLANLLRSNEMAKIGSVLVYVSTQAGADRVAEYLTARSIPAQAYHAGKPASERARIQMAFMRKNRHAPHLAMEAHDRRHNSDVSIRVLVATVAFGMGLDKSDIRAVVHFNLPRSMEAYVQEIGRAGRDGEPACGVLLLAVDSGNSLMEPGKQPEAQSVDAVFIRSWVNADGVDTASIRRLLHQLFPSDFMQKAVAKATNAYLKSLSMESDEWNVSRTAVLELMALEQDIDADHAVVQTLVSYLALKEPGMIRAEPNAHRKCRIRTARTSLGKLADSHLFFKGLVDYANSGIASSNNTQRSRSRNKGSFSRIPGAKKTGEDLVVEIFDLARYMHTTHSEIIAELYKWRAKKEVVLEWQEPSFVVNVNLNMSRFVQELADASRSDKTCPGSVAMDSDMLCERFAQLADKYITDLSEQMSQQHGARIRENVCLVDALESTVLQAARLEPHLQDALLQASIQSYFSSSETARSNLESEENRLLATNVDIASASDTIDDSLRQKIRGFIEQHSDILSSGRAIARILHGLSSPSSPASQWSWCAEWGSLVWTDFETVRLCAQEELVKMRFAEMHGC